MIKHWWFYLINGLKDEAAGLENSGDKERIQHWLKCLEFLYDDSFTVQHVTYNLKHLANKLRVEYLSEELIDFGDDKKTTLAIRNANFSFPLTRKCHTFGYARYSPPRIHEARQLEEKAL